MKKLLCLLTVIIVLVIVAVTFIGGMGLGTGNGNGDGEGAAANRTEAQAEQAADEDVEEEPKPIQTEHGDDMADSEEGTIIEVSVVKNEYFYENKSISLDDLVDAIKVIDGKLIVEITDDRAALKPYNKLIEKLEALNISFVETNIN